MIGDQWVSTFLPPLLAAGDPFERRRREMPLEKRADRAPEVADRKRTSSTSESFMHVLFDLDGTLTDPREGIIASIRFALAKMEIEIGADVDLESFIGPPLQGTFKQLCGSDEAAERGIAFFRERFSTIGLFENRVYDGIPECLGLLADRADSIHIATSKPKVYSDRIIEHFRLGRYFDGVFGSDLDGSLSDKSELLGHILNEKGFEPQDTVMIGDRRFDIAGARNNGIRAIGVLWGYGTKEELAEAGADALCREPSEIYSKVFA
jgi:phosphoglycolate phosphatase